MLRFKNSKEEVVLEMADNGDIVIKGGILNGEEKEEGRQVLDSVKKDGDGE
jgi:hypothetical protein